MSDDGKNQSRGLVSKIALGVVILAVLWLSVYYLRLNQLNSYVENMRTATNYETETDKSIKALKIVVEGKKYTVDDFLKLKEFPVTADVIVAYEDGTMETKSCYVSFNSDIDDFTYRDGVYGRILLPEKYNTLG